MDYYCAFLRGVNVKGTRMKMDELRAVFKRMGYQDLKTILASGNVIFATDEVNMTLLDHKEKIEMNLSLEYAYEAYVIVKDLKQLNDIVEEASQHTIPDNYHHYLLLTNNDEVRSELAQVYPTLQHAEYEKLSLDEHGVYWIFPKGDTLQAEFGKEVLGKKKYKSRITTRTMNTILKVHKYMMGLDE